MQHEGRENSRHRSLGGKGQGLIRNGRGYLGRGTGSHTKEVNEKRGTEHHLNTGEVFVM